MNEKKFFNFIAIGFFIVIICFAVFTFVKKNNLISIHFQQETKNQNPYIAGTTSSSTTVSLPTVLSWPISRATERVTKKPFGIYITPKTSPVQPEKFQGYHTGTDFETFADEQESDVEISAACDGTLLVARYASGYGGVMVQSCTIDNQPVTIIYGHIRLSSITKKVGDVVKAGDKLAVLGTGYSSETDGERKHLHFGIHKGTSVVITGYVQKQSDLSSWLNAMDYM